MKLTDFFFRFAKIFQFLVVAPHQQFFEIFEKVVYLYDDEELDIGNCTVIFIEQTSFRKANNFLNLTQLNIIDFLVISWFDLIPCISVTLRICEMLWETFLVT